jgi:hypothetical protein
VRLRLWLTLAKASVLSSSALVLVRFNCPLGARCGLVVNECELGRLALPHEWRLTEDFDCDAAQLIREVRIGGKVEINPDDIAARDARSGLLERFPVPLPQVFTRGELGVVLCPKLPTPNGGAFASALVRYIVAYKRKAAPSNQSPPKSAAAFNPILTKARARASAAQHPGGKLSAAW